MRMAAQTAVIEAGAVHLPARALWLEDFKKEILSFPASKHDDQIDALSQALQRAFAPGPPVAVFGTYRTLRPAMEVPGKIAGFGGLACA
jgi:hypothetical protein